MFQTLYDSPWHIPFVAFVVAAVTLAAIARKLPFLSAWAVLFTVEITLDAYLTGAWSPLLAHHAALIGTVAVPFVILGDYRYFVLVERQVQRGPRAFGIALAWSLLVPVIAFGTAHAIPHAFIDTRRLFLLYELLFIIVALVFRFVRMPRRFARAAMPVPERVQRWLRRLTEFELAVYVLWAAADIMIFAFGDIGFLVRIVPNVLYYAVFIPFALATAPREAST